MEYTIFNTINKDLMLYTKSYTRLDSSMILFESKGLQRLAGSEARTAGSHEAGVRHLCHGVAGTDLRGHVPVEIDLDRDVERTWIGLVVESPPKSFF